MNDLDNPASEGPSEDEILKAVRSRLLGTLTLSADELRERGLNPDLPDLIHLTGPDGKEHYPAFQFADDAIRPVVIRVNGILGIGELSDSIGAWCWWVDSHEHLGAAPVTLLLNPGNEERLIALAQRVGQD